MNSFPWVSKASGLSPFLSFSLSLFLAKERILAAYHNYMYLLVLRLVCYLVSLVSIGSQPFLISIVPAFQFCPVASPQRGFPIRHDTISLIYTFKIIQPCLYPLHHPRCYFIYQRWTRRHATECQHPRTSKVLGNKLLNKHLPALPTSKRNRWSSRPARPGSTNDPIWATPMIITVFARTIAQMQSQATHPDVFLTITSSIGSIERSASFRDGTWHGYDLTHDLIDPRSHVVFGETTRPPMDQDRSLRIPPATMQPPSYGPLPPLEPHRFSCTLPTIPPPILTPPCL